MKIDVEPEVFDGLFRSVLIEDYKSIREELRKFEHRKDPLPKHLREDWDYYQRLRGGMDIMLTYYMIESDRNRLFEDMDAMDESYSQPHISPYEQDDYDPGWRDLEPPYGVMGDPDIPSAADPEKNAQFWAIQDRIDKLEDKIDSILKMQMRNDYNKHVTYD